MHWQHIQSAHGLDIQHPGQRFQVFHVISFVLWPPAKHSGIRCESFQCQFSNQSLQFFFFAFHNLSPSDFGRSPHSPRHTNHTPLVPFPLNGLSPQIPSNRFLSIAPFFVSVGFLSVTPTPTAFKTKAHAPIYPFEWCVGLPFSRFVPFVGRVNSGPNSPWLVCALSLNPSYPRGAFPPTLQLIPKTDHSATIILFKESMVWELLPRHSVHLRVPSIIFANSSFSQGLQWLTLLQKSLPFKALRRRTEKQIFQFPPWDSGVQCSQTKLVKNGRLTWRWSANLTLIAVFLCIYPTWSSESHKSTPSLYMTPMYDVFDLCTLCGTLCMTPPYMTLRGIYDSKGGSYEGVGCGIARADIFLLKFWICIPNDSKILLLIWQLI